MTLDKAIEVYEFWANAHERDAEYHRPLGYSHETIANVSEGQAREERQIARWLKELKAYRETYPYGVEGYPPRAEQTDGYMTAEQMADYNKMLDKADRKVYGNIEDEPQTE